MRLELAARLRRHTQGVTAWPAATTLSRMSTAEKDGLLLHDPYEPQQQTGHAACIRISPRGNGIKIHLLVAGYIAYNMLGEGLVEHLPQVVRLELPGRDGPSLRADGPALYSGRQSVSREQRGEVGIVARGAARPWKRS